MTSNPQYIAVIGAGVVGLTTALVLARQGHQVIIIAEHLPGDEHSSYTSPWAGAHWRSTAEPDDLLQQELDLVTLRQLLKIESEVGQEAGLLRCESGEHYYERLPSWRDPWYHDKVPSFRYLDAHERHLDSKIAYSFTTVTINVPVYLKWLQHELEKLNVNIIRARLTHWTDVFRELAKVPGQDDSPTLTTVVNCTGGGARHLGGVNDLLCYPTRGQTVLVRRPGFTKSSALWRLHAADNQIYVIPRNDGVIVLGGTFQHHDNNPNPEPATAERIMTTAAKIYPDLLDPSTGKLDVIRHSVGARPSRYGGIRIEAERKNVQGKPVLLLHNYGHGGQGYQSSWGSAERLSALLEQNLAAGALNYQVAKL